MKLTPLHKIRTARGISLRTLANEVGVDNSTLHRIEAGGQVARKDLAAKLAAYFAPQLNELHIIYPERYPDWTVQATASN